MMRERRGARRGGIRAALGAAGAISLVALGAVPAQASDNPVFDAEWALGGSVFNVTQIWSQYQARGSGVTVAVVDSGVDPNQPDLQGSLVPGQNLVDPSNPTTDTADDNSEYHGTDVAAIIAAHGHGGSSDLQGMIGLAPQAKIMPVKVGDAGNPTTASIDAGIEYAADHGAKVINVSVGQADVNGDCDSTENTAVDDALSKGAVVVVASGNQAQQGNESNCFGLIPGVIEVGDVQQNGQIDADSDYNSSLAVAAPGDGIEEPAPNSQYNTGDGTSLAAPWVSAEAALIIGLHPSWTPGQVVRAVIDNTTQGTGQRVDDHVGYGVIDPLKALGAAAPTQTSNPLGGPAAGSSQSAGSGGAASPGSSSAAAAGSSGKSSSIVVYVGIGLGILVLIGLIVFFIGRGKKGGRGGGGGGSGTSASPPQPGPGGMQAPLPGRQPPTAYQGSVPPQQPPPQYSGAGIPYQQAQPPQSYQQPYRPYQQPDSGGGAGQPQGPGYGQSQGQGQASYPPDRSYPPPQHPPQQASGTWQPPQQ